MQEVAYTTEIPAGGHWSLRLHRGTSLRITDVDGGANVGMVFFSSENSLERYNAPDTLKGQHTFKLTKGNCLYSDMGRVFASIVEDSLGWHETLCGNSHAEHVTQQWGKRDYQNNQNAWHQNGTDAFLIELSKYGLTRADLPANVNWFNKVQTDANGQMALAEGHSTKDSQVELRFEMDTLVVLHTCPHPLSSAAEYPIGQVQLELGLAEPVAEDDYCKNWCEENKRAFQNNDLYYLGV
jgi:urea carboxylase-associated protein 2